MSRLNFSTAAETNAPLHFDGQVIVTDPDNRAISSVSGRLVLVTESGWQNAQCGARFQTDSIGKTTLQTQGRLREGAHKRPTNFFASLLSGKEVTDDLQIAVELIYADEPLLYVVEGYRFRSDGMVLSGPFAVFSKDAQGNFTVRVNRSKEGGWLLPQFDGLAVTNPGHDIAGFLFFPSEDTASGKKWVLQCQIKRWPPPVRR